MQRALRLLALARACDAFRLLSSLCLVKSFSVSCANELSICSGQHSALLHLQITTRILLRGRLELRLLYQPICELVLRSRWSCSRCLCPHKVLQLHLTLLLLEKAGTVLNLVPNRIT
eukprot:SAG11_NODE_3149_length_2647_cov_8.649784_3_plen_117_part_00